MKAKGARQKTSLQRSLFSIIQSKLSSTNSGIINFSWVSYSIESKLTQEVESKFNEILPGQNATEQIERNLLLVQNHSKITSIAE